MAAVLDAFAGKLADILAGMVKDEMEMLLGVPGEIIKLETTLGDLSRILGDAERRRIRDSAVEQWVRELKDVMYEADNILDLCQIMEGGEDPSLPRYAPKSSSKCWNIPMTSCFRNPVVAHGIGKKIQALNQRLLDIEKRSSRFGFISQAINSSLSYSADKADSSRRETGPSMIRSDVVGEKIEENTRRLVNLLVKKADARAGSDVAVVAVTGTGGIGKTTLARMVYNDSMVAENFDTKIWLSVNKDANEIDILQCVVSAVGGNYNGFAGNKALLEDALKQAVRQKKFMLVMDDVWSDKVWNELLRAPLNDGAPGSRVLATTRNRGVAHKMRAHYVQQVDKLALEDAWSLLKKQGIWSLPRSKYKLSHLSPIQPLGLAAELMLCRGCIKLSLTSDETIFQQVVLNESDEFEVDGLKDVGMMIVERCGGLPLAVKVIGGLLLNKGRTRGAWIDVFNNVAWSITETNDDLNKAVYVSYEELPPHLKQCLLYCSLFPKDERIRMGVICRMWMAEGFVQNNTSSKLPEDLGSEYYRELISRNLLEPTRKSYNQSACTMHDVVRSFAQLVVKDGLLVNEGQNMSSTLGNVKLRHLSISREVALWGALQTQVSLRTLMLFKSPMVTFKDFLNKLHCLRVLHISDVNLVELPESVCHLKHLRYLGLEGTSIPTIPRDIGDLKFLQVIDVEGCINILQLPESILKLEKLRYISLEGTKITSIPRHFGKLENLVKLFGFPTHLDVNSDDWCSLEELGSLSELRNLGIGGLEKAPSGSVASRAKISSKPHLRVLKLSFTRRLEYNGEVEDHISKEEQERIEGVLGNLRPPPSIEDLTIRGYIGRRLPQWMRMMSVFESLRRLDLLEYACCEQLPNGLGQLPFLDYLWVVRAPSIECIGHDFLLTSLGCDGAGIDKLPAMAGMEIVDRRQRHHLSRSTGVSFPKLNNLGFDGMLEWKEWEWEEQVPAMPALEMLTIGNCKLSHLPPGLAYHAKALRKLQLRNVLHLVCVENFSSLVELLLFGSPKLERISNNQSLQHIHIRKCPGVKVLEDLPSLRSIDWGDLDVEMLPNYLREAELNKLVVNCSLSLLKLISLQGATSEWGKIQHVQQLKAYSGSENYIFYTKEPYSLKTNIAQTSESTGPMWR